MNALVRPIFVSSEEAEAVRSLKEIFKKKIDNWTNEEYDKGWIIEILKINFYKKDEDTNQHWDIFYRAKQDPVHLELLKRLETGL